MPRSRSESIESGTVLPDRNAALDDVTVGLPTFDDDPALVAQLLDAILAEPVARSPIVVDMSRGDAVEDVARVRPRIRYVRYRESAGTSDSRNKVVELTETRYLLFVDADAVPAPGWARGMRDGFVDDVAVVGARCLPVFPARVPPLFDTAAALDLLGMFDLGDAPLTVPRIMGTSFAVDLARLPSRPPFSLAHSRGPGSFEAGEEVQLCNAMREVGWSVRYEPAAVVNHHLRAERLNWRWMLSRARTAGREARRDSGRPEPLPRRFGARDYAFLAAVAPAYFAGRLGR